MQTFRPYQDHCSSVHLLHYRLFPDFHINLILGAGKTNSLDFTNSSCLPWLGLAVLYALESKVVTLSFIPHSKKAIARTPSSKLSSMSMLILIYVYNIFLYAKIMLMLMNLNLGWENGQNHRVQVLKHTFLVSEVYCTLKECTSLYMKCC